MKTNAHFWLYRPQFFLEWEMFQTEDNQNTYFVFIIIIIIIIIILFLFLFLFSKIVPFMR